MDYPFARRMDLVEMLHGTAVADPYRWLEDVDSDETSAWIEAQNTLSTAFLERIPLRSTFQKRLQELWDFDQFGLPVESGGRYFYSHKTGLQNQPALYWQDGLDGAPKMLLDPNTLSTDGTVALMGYEPSPDGKLLAYGVSAAGSDWMTWRVREVAGGQDLPDLVEWVKFSGASWSADGKGFYYSRYDAPAPGVEYSKANYFQKLYYHRLAEAQSIDRLVYQRPDQKEWGFGGQVTDDGRYLTITVWKGTERENAFFYQDLQQPEAGTVELLNGFDAAYEFLGNQDRRFYFKTDLKALNGRIVAIDLDQPQPESWGEIVPESQRALETAHLTGGRLFCIYLKDVAGSVEMFDLDGGSLGEISLPGAGAVLGFGGKDKAGETFYSFTNFFTPLTIYHYKLSGGASSIFRQPALRFDPAEYEMKQVFCQSKDGARVPMFICSRKGLVLNGANPTYLYGYGGFNISVLPAFSVAALAWMEQGGVYAVANLRGGGEYGKAWHDAGRLYQKQNVFDDFIAAAEWLIANDYTCKERLGISGRSNGGLLTGACLTQRPDLYGACVPIVGVLDMLRFHKFTIGWAWVSDYGSPDEVEDFRYLLGYSPYHRIKSGAAYPPTLVCTGDHDDRVHPGHSFKFGAALQAAQAGEAPVLVRIDTRAGHGMGKPTAKLIEETADMLAFLAYHLKVGA